MGSYRLSAVERDQRRSAEWPERMPTLRQWVVLIVGWLMFAVIAPVIVVCSSLYEALVGCVAGAFHGVQECYRMITRWMQMFEEGI